MSRYQAISNLLNRIDDFLYENKDGRLPRSCWISCEDTGAKAYIRKGFYMLDGHNLSCCFCFASIDIPECLQRQGIFTNLLDYVIANCPWEAVYIESVLNIDLARYLLKRGFHIKSGDEALPEGCRSYYLKINKQNTL